MFPFLPPRQAAQAQRSVVAGTPLDGRIGGGIRVAHGYPLLADTAAAPPADADAAADADAPAPAPHSAMDPRAAALVRAGRAGAALSFLGTACAIPSKYRWLSVPI